LAVTTYDGSASRFRLFERRNDRVTVDATFANILLGGITFAADGSRVAFTGTRIAILELPTGNQPIDSELRFIDDSNPAADTWPLWRSPRFSSDGSSLAYIRRAQLVTTEELAVATSRRRQRSPAIRIG